MFKLLLLLLLKPSTKLFKGTPDDSLTNNFISKGFLAKKVAEEHIGGFEDGIEFCKGHVIFIFYNKFFPNIYDKI
jgi:hypothetical protein